MNYVCETKQNKKFYHALAGNRTRASRVAGENSTTEPPVQTRKTEIFLIFECSKQSATLSICGQERRRGDETLRRNLIDRNLSTV